MLQKIKNYTKFHRFNKSEGMDFKRARIIACEPKPEYKVWVKFDDGLEGVVDLSDLVGQGIFKAWNSPEFFNQVHVDPTTDTLSWGNDIDLDPYVIREKIEANKKNKSS